MNRTWKLSVAGIALVLLVSAVWQFSRRSAVVTPTIAVQTPPAETGESAALEVQAVSVASVARPAQASFALDARDSIASWNFQGAYTGKAELIAKAQEEISRLSGLLATATSSAMILAVGIANQYELIGDGKNQYEYLGRAIRAAETNGLPWHNLGVLMERLEALNTARTAYRQATLVQPSFREWHYAYLEFLTTRMKEDAADIEKAYAAAVLNLGENADILRMYSAWKNA